jgi:phenylpyruvate tautomerase PptA (4-oxalocrotonate tautomerase family)
MPMLDITIPENALDAKAEQELMRRLTDVLLENEGADPKDPRVRSIAWVFLHRPAQVFVAGQKAITPHYRVVAAVPEGQFDGERRSAMVAAVTEAVLDAEEEKYPRDASRVWVFANEIPDGTWGGRGRIYHLADIAGMVLGDLEKGRQYAEQRLSGRAK